jgi:t-SNARE complex subunit (syntaxin)
LPLKEVTKMAARKAETDTILDVLSYTRWNRRKTATLLKISYKALLNKIKEYEIEKQYRELNRELAKGQMSPASAEASAWQGGRGRGSMGMKH